MRQRAIRTYAHSVWLLTSGKEQPFTKNPEPRTISMIDINKIQSALQSLKEERAHIEVYIQNAAAKKKELDKELNASFNSIKV